MTGNSLDIYQLLDCTVDGKSQQFKLKDKSKYEEFINESDLKSSLTNITIVEIHSQGEMRETYLVKQYYLFFSLTLCVAK